jgi:hypothetical protein
LNVHAHVLALDGVYVRDEKTEALAFRPLPTPTRSEVAEFARRTAERIEKLSAPTAVRSIPRCKMTSWCARYSSVAGRHAFVVGWQ